MGKRIHLHSRQYLRLHIRRNATAEFTAATDTTGWTGCNSCGARYRVGEPELRLDELTWTEAGCPSQALFRQEQGMQHLLATVERFEVSDQQLTLTRRRRSSLGLNLADHAGPKDKSLTT